MCGIFGVVAKEGGGLAHPFAERTLHLLARCSESRGKDSSGFAFRNAASGTISVLRAALPITALMKRQEFSETLKGHFADSEKEGTCGPTLVSAIGHSRLVTNGSQLKPDNNQPVVRDGLVGVHNGIIVNEEELWKLASGAERRYDIDTEVLLALFRHYDRTGYSSEGAMAQALSRVSGTVSTAFFVDNRDELILGTNNGSLYFMTDDESVFVFASERHTLETLRGRNRSLPSIAHLNVTHVAPNNGCVLDLQSMRVRQFKISNGAPNGPKPTGIEPYRIAIDSIASGATHRSLLVDFRDIAANPRAGRERRLLQYDVARVARLRRCSKCVLPESFPFISFDGNGVCNYCLNYRPKNQPKSLDELRALVEPYRRGKGEYDCIVPYSGGRDSTFTLHMVKNVLGMNPITLTYDWGMVTDLARRNIARACGRLGVENIIVAADIKRKRENIRKNILAWLKRPSLGMIPLFMSGDKYFFYYTNRLKRQTGIQLNVWGINPLENTDFKTGFAGVPPRFDKKRIYSLTLGDQARFFSYVGSNFLLNPSYINSSNLDSLGSIASRYLHPQKDYYSFFDYYRWNEQEVEDLIFVEYDWERAIDTRSTWRIGDGTASFYNYIYFTVAGFSENDTFRSNQIREGLLTRENALVRIGEENAPRYENIKWYLDIVGVDFESAITVINRIAKRYPRN